VHLHGQHCWAEPTLRGLAPEVNKGPPRHVRPEGLFHAHRSDQRQVPPDNGASSELIEQGRRDIAEGNASWGGARDDEVGERVRRQGLPYMGSCPVSVVMPFIENFLSSFQFNVSLRRYLTISLSVCDPPISAISDSTSGFPHSNPITAFS
jgi:hypothetical protein